MGDRRRFAAWTSCMGWLLAVPGLEAARTEAPNPAGDSAYALGRLAAALPHYPLALSAGRDPRLQREACELLARLPARHGTDPGLR